MSCSRCGEGMEPCIEWRVLGRRKARTNVVREVGEATSKVSEGRLVGIERKYLKLGKRKADVVDEDDEDGDEGKEEFVTRILL